MTAGSLPAPAGLAEVAAARRQLGAELVRRRTAARFSQTDLARKVRCARSTLSASEHGHSLGSQELWLRIDELLGAGGVLLRQRDEIAAIAAVAADDAVREGLRAPGGRPLTGTVSGGGEHPITAMPSCPYCGWRFVLRVELRPVRLPEQRAPAMALMRWEPSTAESGSETASAFCRAGFTAGCLLVAVR